MLLQFVIGLQLKIILLPTQIFYYAYNEMVSSKNLPKLAKPYHGFTVQQNINTA